MHTKGPWKVDTWHYREAGRENVTVIQTDTDAIAEVLPLWCPDDRKGEMDANARLIAGAPEMIEALKQVEKWIMVNHYGPVSCLDAVTEIIERVEGGVS